MKSNSASTSSRSSAKLSPKPEETKLEGSLDGLPRFVWNLPARGVKRYILTAAQNNTRVHEKVWNNLQVLAEYYGAKILVSRFTYNKQAYGKLSIKPDTEIEEYDELWYDPKLAECFNDDQVELAPGLVWCGELNILPTAVRPLSEMENYTGRASSIIPHTKQQMESVPAPKGLPVKFLYSTGAVTKKNYIKKKAGMKSERYHCYGAVLVEVLPDGSWFVRQLRAAGDGSICDLNVMVKAGTITEEGVEAINWGDVHFVEIDKEVERLAWGPEGMLLGLRPKYQFFHDTLDFLVHHRWNEGDHHTKFMLRGKWDIKREIYHTASFLDRAHLKGCTSVVVYSNHDDRLRRWLKDSDFRKDPFNAEFYLEAQLAYYRSLDAKKPLNLFEWAARKAVPLKEIVFLRPDESFVICKRWDGGIECGMHGDAGSDGAPGSPRAFARMGRAANIGHSHRAGILDDVFTAGECNNPGYAKGPSSHSKSHIVTYKNGQRAIVTMWNGRWRAPPP